MAIWFIKINVSEVLLIKLSAQADGNSSVTWNKPLQCWEPAKHHTEQHAGSGRQISLANSIPRVSYSKTQRQLVRSTSPEAEVQDDFSEFVLKSLPLLCRLLYENKKKLQQLLGSQIPVVLAVSLRINKEDAICHRLVEMQRGNAYSLWCPLALCTK